MILFIWAPMKKNFVLVNFIVSVLEVVALLGTCYRENWERKIVLNEPHVDEKSLYNNFLILWKLMEKGWCALTVALAILVLYAVKKESHYLCNTWFMCECLMLIFVLFVSVYIYTGSGSNGSYKDDLTVKNDNIAFLRRPKMKCLILLHIFLKMYGLWVISDFMNSLNARLRRISSLIQAVHPNIPSSIIISNKNANESFADEKECKNESHSKEDTPEAEKDDSDILQEPEIIKEREFKESFKYQRL